MKPLIHVSPVMTPARTKVNKQSSGLGGARNVTDSFEQDTLEGVLFKVAVFASGVHAGRLYDHTAFHGRVKITGIVVTTGCIECVAVVLATVQRA